MGQREKRRPHFDRGGFVLAGALAPGMALTIFYLALSLTERSARPGDVGSLIGSFLQALLIVSIWGVVPSLAFGGLALAVIRQIPRRGQPATIVCMVGGMAAAGLYVLAGLGIAGLSPGIAMLFAPWAMPDLWGPSTDGEDWWLVASLLLAGAGAGLIYAAFAKRG